MATCDVCNASTSWEEGTAYTADEFRQIVSQGFEPPEAIIMFSVAMTGVSREQAIVQWKQSLVTQSTTGWLLCPACAARAARYMPKPAGAKPADHKLAEPVTPEMLAPVQEPSKEVASEEVAESPLAPAEPPPEAAVVATKKCPVCAKEIKLEARACRYCGARFEVAVKGYCTQCHTVVDADENDKCKRCGSEVLDRRIESSLLEEEAPQPEPQRVLQVWERKGEGVEIRLYALLVDLLVILMLSAVPVGLLALLAWLIGGGSEIERGIQVLLAGSSLLIVPGIWFLYFTILEGTFGATLGKAVGVRPPSLKVIKKDGSRCGYVRAAIRAFLGLFETNLLGALVIWLTVRHQRIGDLIAGTLVVDTRKVLTVSCYSTPSAVFEFIDGRRVEIGEIIRGNIEKWHHHVNTLNIVGVTPQGERVSFSVELPDARVRRLLRDELEHFFEVRITEHTQWWQLALWFVLIVFAVAIGALGYLYVQGGVAALW